jgi:hypothetical protein
MSQHELVDNTLIVVPGGVLARCTCGWQSGPRFSSMVASALFRDHLESVGQPHRDEEQGARTAVFTRAFVPDNMVKPWLQHLRDFDIAHPGCHFEVMADMGNVPIEVMVEMMRLNPGFSFQKIFDRNGDESLYDVAREVCHKHGMDWTDPRTGEKHPAPKGDKA